MDQTHPNQLLLYETVVILRGTTGVGQPIPGNAQCLCFYSRILQPSPIQKEKDLWKLYSDYGASPRSLFLHAHNPDQYKDFVKTEIYELLPGSLTKLLLDTSTASEASHHIITMGPLPEDRSKPYRTFASPYVFQECCKLIFEDEADVLRVQYDTLHHNPTTSTAAGMVFKYRAHQFLQKKKTITLFPILSHTSTSGNITFDSHKAMKNTKKQKQVNLPNLEDVMIFTVFLPFSL